MSAQLKEQLGSRQVEEAQCSRLSEGAWSCHGADLLILIIIEGLLIQLILVRIRAKGGRMKAA